MIGQQVGDLDSTPSKFVGGHFRPLMHCNPYLTQEKHAAEARVILTLHALRQ